MNHHIAIFNQTKIKGNTPDDLLQKISTDFLHKKGAIFGLSALKIFLDLEYKHDDFTLTKHITTPYGAIRKLTSFSSGQQKQLLLKHLRKQIPNLDYLVLDNPYDCMDVETQELFSQEEHLYFLLSLQIYLEIDKYLPNLLLRNSFVLIQI